MCDRDGIRQSGMSYAKIGRELALRYGVPAIGPRRGEPLLDGFLEQIDGIISEQRGEAAESAVAIAIEQVYLAIAEQLPRQPDGLFIPPIRISIPGAGDRVVEIRGFNTEARVFRVVRQRRAG